MKLSKYAALVRKGGYCIAAHVEGDGVWLGTSAAIYRAAELPDAEGEGQIRAILDISEKVWEKVYLKEVWAESVRDIFGMDLSPYVKGEQDAEKLRTAIATNGLWSSVMRCKQDDELLFYNDGMLSPLQEELKESDYIKYTVRTRQDGNRFLVVRDGFDVLAAVMPRLIINEEFIGDLAEFQALCTEQFYREKNHARVDAYIGRPAETEAAEEAEDEAEQIGMEDAAEDGE